MRIVIDMQGAQTDSRYRGIGRYTLSLATAMVRNRGKHEILLALNGELADSISSIRDNFHRLLPRENIRLWFAPGPNDAYDPANRARRAMAEQIREAFLLSLQPDAVVITTHFEEFAVSSIGEFELTTPVATILYDLFPLLHPAEHEKTEKFIFFYSRQLDFLKRSRLLLAISECSRQEAIQALSLADTDVVNISSACNPIFRKIENLDGRISSLYAKLGMTKPFLLYVGAVDSRKNLHRYIQAYAALPSAVRSRHQVLFAGKMPHDSISDLRKTARQFGLTKSEVIFSGHISDDDLILLYNSCALFILPSLYEGFGLPALEAMACGAPVIGSNTSSLPEVIGREEALFDPYSVNAISEKMYEGLTDEQFRRRLIVDGLAQAKNFSWDLSAQKAIAALEGLVTNKSLQNRLPLLIEEKTIFSVLDIAILLLKLDHIGDFLLALPAISRIRAKYPAAAIDIVVGSWNVPLAKATGLFRTVYSLDFFSKNIAVTIEPQKVAISTLFEQLGTYDIAIDLRRQRDTRFLLAQVQAGLRVGYQSFDESIDGLLDCVLPGYPDVQFETTPLNKTHIANQMLALVDALPADPNDYVQLPVLGQRQAVRPGFVAIFPKAGGTIKEWDINNFFDLAALLAREEVIDTITIYFSSKQEALAWQSPPMDKVRVLAGLPLPELITSLSEHALCVANNSGGAHLAAYLGVTVIALFSGHETVDEWAPPFGETYVIHTGAACSPCHKGRKEDCEHDVFCLKDISVDFVFNKVMETIWQRQNPDVSLVRKEYSELFPFFNNTQACIRYLLPILARLHSGSLPSNTILELTQCLATSFPCQCAKKQLLVDISELVRRDSKTGIQRVVRSLLWYMLKNPPCGYFVKLIYFPNGGFRYLSAARFAKTFLDLPLSEADIDIPIEYAPGDIYFGMDLNLSDLDAYGTQIRNMHNQGVKVVYHIYDLLCQTLGDFFPAEFSKLFEQWLRLTTEADKVICISKTTANDYEQWLVKNALPRLPYVTINWSHLGADIVQSCPSKGLPESAKHILRRLSGYRSFLMVGTLEPRKGHKQVIEAFEQLWKKGNDVLLVIVGKQGWQVDALIKKLKRHPERENRLFWLEGISDEYLEKIYAASTCLIAASEGEGFGLPLVEAAQHKLPIIARDIPIFREVAGEHAWYFSGKRSADLAEAVATWLTLYEKGTHPRSDNMPWLTWEQSAKKTLAILLHNEMEEDSQVASPH